MNELIDYLDRQMVWSRETFGVGKRTLGIVDHIRKELEEIIKDPCDVEEWCDVIILALDGAWRAGHSSKEIWESLRVKQIRNFDREWTIAESEDVAVEHIRE